MDAPFAPPDEPAVAPRGRSLLDRLPSSIRAVSPTIGANLINQAVVALSQIVVIPLLVAKWGLAGYGSWLLLTAIPTYLAISDLGFTTSAKSDMAMRVARGDTAGARVTASSVAALLAIALLLVGVVYFGLVFIVDWPGVLKLENVALGSAQSVLALGFVQIAAYQAFLLSASIFRAAGKPATEVLLSALFRALETAALVVAALLGGDVIAAAAAWAATRLLTTIGTWLVIARRYPDLSPGPRAIEFARIRALLPPSLGYMLLPLANAISIQGTVLLLGAVMGPVAVATLTAIRVVTRLGVSAANTLAYAFTPQYSYALGGGNKDRFRNLLRTHIVLLAAGSVAFLLVMAVLGPWLVGLLTHTGNRASVTIVLLMSLAAALEMAWGLPVAVGSAENRVGRLAIVWLLFGSLGVAATFVLVGMWGTIGVPLGLIAAHLAMSLFAWRWWLRWQR
jgi:O-antigen/teichoic acid export membrane protein